MFLIQSALNMEASSRFLNQSLIDRHRDSLNKVEGPANKDVLFELGLLEGRIDQKNLKELISKGIENLKEKKIQTSLHYLNMGLQKLGHVFSEQEEVDNYADTHFSSTTEDPLLK